MNVCGFDIAGQNSQLKYIPVKYPDNNCTYWTYRIRTVIQQLVLEFHSAVDF